MQLSLLLVQTCLLINTLIKACGVLKKKVCRVCV
uniref:Uncharacterized protein n=1 Tax=Anguilla anguilla TaxID=7936 RepID=A0A0E9S9W5_ANGAN